MTCKCGTKLPETNSLLNDLQKNILENSFIKQEEFAFSAALVFMATLTSRKFVFGNQCSNLYVLNVAPSGSGKDAPQQKLKEYLMDIRAESLLGSGDYVSDASLMDSLGYKPVRLDIFDEAGGILKSINGGKAEYNGKMADVLAELYTSSNSKYLGRQTAEGRKGECYRPNVNILASTTPTGFQEGISRKAIEKGLMARFLVFLGDGSKPAERVRRFTRLTASVLERLSYINSIDIKEGQDDLSGISQRYYNIEATKEAHDKLDEIFQQFDKMRRESDDTDVTRPVISRLYQQMQKIVMIHAVSRLGTGQMPEVTVEDVKFGYETIMYYFNNMKSIVKKYVHEGFNDRRLAKAVDIIEESGGSITKTLFARKTKAWSARDRKQIIEELIDMGYLVVDNIQQDGKRHIAYFLTKEA